MQGIIVPLKLSITEKTEKKRDCTYSQNHRINILIEVIIMVC